VVHSWRCSYRLPQVMRRLLVELPIVLHRLSLALDGLILVRVVQPLSCLWPILLLLLLLIRLPCTQLS
jgi:hypothetical protein